MTPFYLHVSLNGISLWIKSSVFKSLIHEHPCSFNIGPPLACVADELNPGIVRTSDQKLVPPPPPPACYQALALFFFRAP